MRNLNGCKQINVANALQINQSTYCRIEAGEVPVTPGQLKIIAHEIQVPLTLIFAIADADEKINFKITNLSEILIKFVLMFNSPAAKTSFTEDELEFIIKKIKSAYEKSLK